MTTYQLPGRRGTVTLHDDGTATVRDNAGRAVTTLEPAAVPPGVRSWPRAIVPARQ